MHKMVAMDTVSKPFRQDEKPYKLLLERAVCISQLACINKL
jgi:hypothetical protein